MSIQPWMDSEIIVPTQGKDLGVTADISQIYQKHTGYDQDL